MVAFGALIVAIMNSNNKDN
ncbi:TPA: hypothetical protein ACSKOM_002850 [Listeria monocytogenes]|nr:MULTISPECIES: hypothetical protein [Listeria]